MPTENGAARGQLSNVSPNGHSKQGGRRRSRPDKKARQARQRDAVLAFVNTVISQRGVAHEEIVLGVACVGKLKPGGKMDITVQKHKVHGSTASARDRIALVKLVLGVMHEHHLLGREDVASSSQSAIVSSN